MRGPSRGRGACPPPAEHAARLREKKASPRRLAVPFTWPQTVNRPRRVAVPEPEVPRPEQCMLAHGGIASHVGVYIVSASARNNRGPLQVTVSPAPRAERKQALGSVAAWRASVRPGRHRDARPSARLGSCLCVFLPTGGKGGDGRTGRAKKMRERRVRDRRMRSCALRVPAHRRAGPAARAPPGRAPPDGMALALATPFGARRLVAARRPPGRDPPRARSLTGSPFLLGLLLLKMATGTYPYPHLHNFIRRLPVSACE